MVRTVYAVQMFIHDNYVSKKEGKKRPFFVTIRISRVTKGHHKCVPVYGSKILIRWYCRDIFR